MMRKGRCSVGSGHNCCQGVGASEKDHGCTRWGDVSRVERSHSRAPVSGDACEDEIQGSLLRWRQGCVLLSTQVSSSHVAKPMPQTGRSRHLLRGDVAIAGNGVVEGELQHD